MERRLKGKEGDRPRDRDRGKRDIQMETRMKRIEEKGSGGDGDKQREEARRMEKDRHGDRGTRMNMDVDCNQDCDGAPETAETKQ